MARVDPSSPSALALLNANHYGDLGALQSLKSAPRSPQAIHAVAEQVDALFLQMMLKSMRDAGRDVGDHESDQLGMYQGMFDDQVALAISARGGLGLGELVARQLAAQQGTADPSGADGPNAPPVAAGAPAAPVTGTVEPPTATGTTVTAPPTAAAGPPTPQAAAQFVGAVLPAIRVAARSLGVNPIGLLAQAVLETGWGRRMARTADGAPSFNLFGIKAGDRWRGARTVSPTIEFRDGVATARTAAFRAYRSVADSVADFANLLRESPRYRTALGAGEDVGAYIEGIAAAGYATDPAYASKLAGVVRSGAFRDALRAASAGL
ncbi:MAG: flagellar assembly peptidoglycan hydrolase FlgJ [Gammaproteobacteria bacterium]|nr:flagellar assembly peptidoglycan hydrolase FlgJ [Gammaproteobacteria bacterium]